MDVVNQKLTTKELLGIPYDTLTPGADSERHDRKAGTPSSTLTKSRLRQESIQPMGSSREMLDPLRSRRHRSLAGRGGGRNLCRSAS